MPTDPLDTEPLPEVPNPFETEQLPEIPGYRVLETLGEGGMGTVYAAEQTGSIRRLVAIKLIKLGMDSKDVLARFEFERRTLAAMNHRSIAKIFEASTTERGQPYFVMELIEGLPITTYCDKHRSSVEERIELFRAICAGVQHAHQKGVIHRDLKPGNVIVAREDDLAIPKILDFGLAKATNRDLLAKSAYTEQGLILGTPEYMAPEQAAFDQESVDTRADIYSLGVMLYELLSGQLPFSVVELRQADWAEMRRKLAEDEPPRPSTKLIRQADQSTQVAHKRRTTLPALSRALRGDLDWIVLKAMAKEPERRYESAATLAADLEHYLRREPVIAGPPGTGYRLRKFVQRHRISVIATLAIALTLLASVVAVVVSAQQARETNRRYDLLATSLRLRTAESVQQTLFPARAERIPDFEAWLDDYGDPLTSAAPQVRRAVEQLRELEPPLSEPDKFLLGSLTELEANLDAFLGDRGTKARVGDRLRWARSVRQRTIRGPAAAWEDARQAILTSGRYGDLDLPAQLGLVPLGENPTTGLWEFVHLRSGADGREVPARDPATTEPRITAESGAVFVLIPASRDDDAFFIGKHEVTIAQWERMSEGELPNLHRLDLPPSESWTHPVEQVGLERAREVARRHALRLPTSAEWETAARGGTTSRWWTGEDPTALEHAANLADQSLRKRAPRYIIVPWDDSYPVHMPVDRMAPNPFGLFCVHGNVGEFCSDEIGGAAIVRGGDYLMGPDGIVFGSGGELKTSSRKPNGRTGIRLARSIDA